MVNLKFCPKQFFLNLNLTIKIINYSPMYFGGRFSLNDFRPSILSLVGINFA